jgi:hypothetical protein
MNESTNNIMRTLNQYPGLSLFEKTSPVEEYGKAKVFDHYEMQKIRTLKQQKKNNAEIAKEFGFSQWIFYNIRIDTNHPNHQEMVDIFGKVKRQNKTVESISIQHDDQLQQIAFNFFMSYIMSEKSKLNAREKLCAQLYKQLRLDNEKEPLHGETLALYNSITNELIQIAKKHYEEANEETNETNNSEKARSEN